ncbi:MAG: exonuclease domain-containing protein [Oscillospiraceae bacterium]|nr:exonuclease domain-containing protein [Oscillospiraceae bacterium]
MIVLDLEWNRGYDKQPLNEILQIGAVRIERLGGPIVDVFDARIRPTVHKKFDLGAKKLPELKSFKSSRTRFPAAAEAFRAWCGGETAFAGWGTGDVEALNENCKYWGLPPFQAEEFFDFQRAFAHAVGADQQIALWRAAEYCAIPDVFDYHSAVNDAMYTAVLGRWLTWEDLAWRPEPAPPKRRRMALRLSQFPFPRQERQKVGPAPTPQEALDARSSRTPACPVCGQRLGVARWHFAVPKMGFPQQFYGVFTCPEHGRFLCRVTLARREDGQWQGRRSVPAITPELTQEYAAALDGGVHVCRGGGRRRRGRRSGGRGKDGRS